ncbi:ParA family protein [Halalkalicoccus jeotgali]|uniref:Cobyrinic acid ac-diamide synthase n=1 Tax=Halalkalicoccus jeotgali (strain DSM 18796 / CECT 7217 / JCM 14584 / KCTC 4019 / B3) TaxID=795797 RepID=D8J9Z4_HALJB|nr:AAA family ATPase [Halalkalicoccus jeotgali]ADJ14516.1 Cobyrinic acid ac-diamide synthase [Halalkalicoccus jeotgali B3]ELY40089.1 Cobyrinic acid ac-diamide synthase [Halalkalicoccus jeotgali B3]
MAKKIAITNQKGGVGKTTVAINLAGALNQVGEDVLFVDLDPQGNATEGLGFTGEYDDASGPSLYDTLLSDQSTINDILVDHDELRLAPSNIEMFNAEPELITEMRNRERLDMALEQLDADPDYIIIDCPPWLGILTDSALLACDSIVVPGLAESTSTRAVEILFDQVDTIEENFDETIAVDAIAANRVENDGESDEMMTWFRETFEPAVPVYEIRKRVALKRAWSNGTSIFHHEEECDMGDVFLEMAEVVR